MSGLEGTYLPVPPVVAKAKGKAKAVTAARVMALLAQLTPIPVEELRAMDEELRQPSRDTHKRLQKDLAVEVTRLKPVPVSSLFGPEVYTSINQVTACPPPVETVTDPQIAAVYGPDGPGANH